MSTYSIGSDSPRWWWPSAAAGVAGAAAIAAILVLPASSSTTSGPRRRPIHPRQRPVVLHGRPGVGRSASPSPQRSTVATPGAGGAQSEAVGRHRQPRPGLDARP